MYIYIHNDLEKLDTLTMSLLADLNPDDLFVQWAGDCVAALCCELVWARIKRISGRRPSWVHSYDAKHRVAWWRHRMETFSTSLAFSVENLPVTGAFPTQRPVTRSFDVWSAPELIVEQTMQTLEIWNVIAPIMTSLKVWSLLPACTYMYISL